MATPTPLHPAFDPDHGSAEPPAIRVSLDQLEAAMIAQVEDQVQIELRSLAVMEQGNAQLRAFTGLLIEIRKDQQALRREMIRLANVIAGER